MAEVSVVIPTHDRARWLPRAVASAQAAGREVEVIVVDDASTDDTPHVCAGLAGIRYVRLESNVGLARARNAGIAESRGEFLAFLDDDDQRLPGSLDLEVAALRRNPAASLAYGPVLVGDPVENRPGDERRPARPIGGDIFWRLLETNFIYVPSTLVRRARVVELGGFDLDVPGVEDWYLWLRLAERAPVVACDQPMAIYRLAAPSSRQMSSDQARMSRMSERVRERAEQLSRVVEAANQESDRLARYTRNVRSDRLIWTAAHALACGRPREARRNLLAALRLHPRRAVRPWTFQLLLATALRSSTNDLVGDREEDLESEAVRDDRNAHRGTR